jgi:hypothetical protein
VGNILVDALPESVTVNGRDYAINTDFRVGLNIILAYEDSELTPTEKALVLLELLYPEKPENLIEAVKEGVRFLDGTLESNNRGTEEGSPVRLYSFQKDANYIFSAFQQTHGIDLTKTKLHWWQFLALFMDLGSETAFCNIIGLRNRLHDGTATKEERKRAKTMDNILKLPEVDNRTLEEKELEREFLRRVELGKQRRGET